MNAEEKDERIATLESLLADVYTIIKPIAEGNTHGTYSPILHAYTLVNAQDFAKREDGAS